MRIDTNKSRSNALLVSFRVFSRFSILKCEKTRKDARKDKQRHPKRHSTVRIARKDAKRQAKTPQET